MKKLSKVFFIAILVFGFGSNAGALTINANDYIYPGGLPSDYWWAGPQTSQSAINGIIGGIMGAGVFELYKQDVGAASDTGGFAPYYTTTFSNTPTDPRDATIVWEGGAFISGSPLYLLVKDGNANPGWYLFGMNYVVAPDWDGQETISLVNFWPNEGAISHVTIYGAAAVPEPATMFLLSAGLVGIWGFRRKFRK